MRTILVADDHPLIRAGIKAQIDVLGQATVLESWDEASTRAVVARHPDIDLVLLDIQMPGDAAEWTWYFCKDHPGLPVLLVSGLDERALTLRFRPLANVRGVIQKARPNQELRACIDLALAGIEQWPDADPLRGTAPGAADVRRTRIDSLTPRQKDVARLVCTGMSNREIAERLSMQEGTVKNHLKEAFAKLGVSNRTQLARRFDLEGWGDGAAS